MEDGRNRSQTKTALIFYAFSVARKSNILALLCILCYLHSYFFFRSSYPLLLALNTSSPSLQNFQPQLYIPVAKLCCPFSMSLGKIYSYHSYATWPSLLPIKPRFKILLITYRILHSLFWSSFVLHYCVAITTIPSIFVLSSPSTLILFLRGWQHVFRHRPWTSARCPTLLNAR